MTRPDRVDRFDRFELAYRHCVALARDDPRVALSRLLECACGDADCWCLLARSTVAEDRVTWSGFRPLHRDDWTYDLGPFVFERGAYEAQAVPP